MYTLTVRGIKNILREELKRHKESTFNVLYNSYVPDVQKEIVSNGYGDAFTRLDACTSYEELDELLSHLGYRMSLEDWIQSL